MASQNRWPRPWAIELWSIEVRPIDEGERQPSLIADKAHALSKMRCAAILRSSQRASMEGGLRHPQCGAFPHKASPMSIMVFLNRAWRGIGAQIKSERKMRSSGATLRRCAIPLVFAFSLHAIPATAQHASPPAASARQANPYDAYASLIGEWDVAPEGQPTQMVEHFAWAANRSYITFGASTISNGTETPHFEGVLMWDGVDHRLNMLVMLDLSPAARVTEKGYFYRDENGVFVREITASYSEGTPMATGGQVAWAGATGHFRQTFTVLGPDRMRTRVMRQSADGWAPTFPGSDNLIMTRRRA